MTDVLRTRSRQVPSILAYGAAILALGLTAFARQAATAPSTLDGDPEALEVLRRLDAHYAATNGVTGRMTVISRMGQGGRNLDMTSEFDVALSRPNRFAARFTKGMMGATSLSDGRELITHIPMFNRYTMEPAPATFQAALDQMGAMPTPSAGMGLQVLLRLFCQEPSAQFGEDAEAVRFVGTEPVGGVDCARVRYVAPFGDLDLWIEAGETPWLRRFSPDLQKAMQQMGDDAPPELAEMSVSLVIELDRWSAEPVADERFAFVPPAGAEQVASLMEGMVPDDARPPAPPPSELVGRPAPAFTAHRLDGDPVEFAPAPDGQVLVLDFWATWCGPCRKALPVLAEVTAAFRDRGVEFYAVDLREEDEKVRRFMTQRGYDFPVLMDRDGAIAKTFGVGPIPHTVLIGADGVVQAVHVGLAPNLRERLTGELETLVAGGTLVVGSE